MRPLQDLPRADHDPLLTMKSHTSQPRVWNPYDATTSG